MIYPSIQIHPGMLCRFVMTAVMLLALPFPLHAADDLLTSQMVDEARLWQTKGRRDLAANTWHRILVTNPQHGEALASLGLIEANAGNLVEAQSLFLRAKRAGYAGALMARLRNLVETESSRKEANPVDSRVGSLPTLERRSAQPTTKKPSAPPVSSRTVQILAKSDGTATSMPTPHDGALVPIVVLPPAVQVTPIHSGAPIPPPVPLTASPDNFPQNMQLKPSDSINSPNTLKQNQTGFEKFVAADLQRIKPCKQVSTNLTQLN